MFELTNVTFILTETCCLFGFGFDLIVWIFIALILHIFYLYKRLVYITQILSLLNNLIFINVSFIV